jgi:hypothetical protein
VQRDAPSDECSQYELNTNLVLRRSTAMAPTARRPTKPRKVNTGHGSRKNLGRDLGIEEHLPFLGSANS